MGKISPDLSLDMRVERGAVADGGPPAISTEVLGFTVMMVLDVALG